MSRDHEDDLTPDVRDGLGDGEERHDPDERSGRGAGQARVGRDELSGRVMTDFEHGPGEDDGEDELALRRLFHGAVSGLEPSTASLDHLRRAVPARRARKRQALVGAAAAAVLIGTAVPALIHVAGSPGLTAANPALAGHGEQAQGGTGAEAEGGDPAGTKAPSVKVSPTTGPTKGATDKGEDKPDPKGGGTGSGSGQGSDGGSGSLRSCGRGDLQSAGGYNSGPDSTGVVYGGFTIVNGSGKTCRVDGSGLVHVTASGAADQSRIAVIRHTSGDPATGLPDPSADIKPLVLEPGASYRLKFAWVPSASCSTDGGGATPTPTEPTEVPTEPTPTPTEPTEVPTEPTPTPTGGGEGADAGGTDAGGADAGGTGTGTGSGTGTDSGLSTQLLRAEPAGGSVAVSYTAEPGDPTVTTVLNGVCAGTIYRTGMLQD
ncbi:MULTISPECIES: hypothetical protein [unclassified Streptomyces]|uniref:hypothetical protein n=1 Tax=unclassified Streptomyces TaxID=2593676 RepID=UPI0036FB193C